MKITGISRNVLKLEDNIYTYHGGVDVYTHTQARAQTNTVFHPFYTFLSIHPLPPPHPYFLGSCSYFQTLFAAPKHNHIYITNVSWGPFFARYKGSMRLGYYHCFCQALTAGFTGLFTPKITIITIYILLFPSQKDKEL